MSEHTEHPGEDVPAGLHEPSDAETRSRGAAAPLDGGDGVDRARRHSEGFERAEPSLWDGPPEGQMPDQRSTVPLEGAADRGARAAPKGSAPTPAGPVRGDGDRTPPAEADGETERRDPGEGEDLTLPDWRDPPTGDVPRILEEIAGVAARELTGPRTGELPSIDDDVTVPVGEQANGDRREPISSEGRGEPPRAAGAHGRAGSPRANGQREGRAQGTPRRGQRRAPGAAEEVRPASRQSVVRSRRGGGRQRSKLQSTLTGLVLGGIVAAALLLGRVWVLAVVGLALELAASEAFTVLRRAGSGEARFLGMAGVGALVGVAYAEGTRGLIGVVALAFLVTSAWYLLGPLRRPAFEGLAHTLGVTAWVGVLGSFAALLLSPATFGGHGELVLVAAIGTTVADDSVAFFVGSVLGRHKLAPRISPGKTIEGFVGGTVGALVAGTLLGLVRPLHPVEGLMLGAVVAVVAPLGDLLESAFKRQFGVKDSGALLPGHGGVLDRIDAMLFVLPAAYYLFVVMHLS